jgi:glycosyltransferase involved in cell wall biosynthesis
MGPAHVARRLTSLVCTEDGGLMTVALIIPVWNEAAAIGQVLAEVPPGAVEQVIVVDGGSRDGTVERARAAGATVIHQRRRGYGAACAEGVAAASDVELLVFLDGDYSDPPACIPHLLAPLHAGQADLVLGSRVLGGMARDALPVQAVLGNQVVTGLIRVLYRRGLTDLPSAKAIRRETLIGFQMQEMTYGWTTEMIVKALRLKCRVVEIGVPYRARGGGRSKVSGTLMGTLLAGYHLVATTLRYAGWRPAADGSAQPPV